MTTTDTHTTPTLDRPVTVAPKTHGNCSAPTTKRRICVAWELDTTNGVVTVNGEKAARVLETVPGHSYAFDLSLAPASPAWQGKFESAAVAAECAAVCYTLSQYVPY